MRKRASRKTVFTACIVFFVLCSGIKGDPTGMKPNAKMSIQQIEREFDVKFVAALPGSNAIFWVRSNVFLSRPIHWDFFWVMDHLGQDTSR